MGKFPQNASMWKIRSPGRSHDFLIIAGLIVIALAFALGRIGTHFGEYPFLGSDAANIASFAAALDHPQLFAGDPLLKKPANFAFYQTFHIPYIRFFGRALGDYGSAFALLIFPVAFLHLLGYYLLGKILFKNRALSLFFTLAAMVPVKIALVEWGFMRDVVPRFLFQALLPFILISVLTWGKNPKSWPWLMGGTGLLVYVHPVSLPAWGLAIFLSLWFLAPEIRGRRRAGHWVGAAFVLLIVIAPFVINYLSTTDFGVSEGIEYEKIRVIMEKRFKPGSLDIQAGLKEFVNGAFLSHGLNLGLFSLALLGGIGVFVRRRHMKNSIPGVIAAWWAGMIIVGALIPLAEHSLTTALKRMPLEIDLIRSLRYVFLLLLLSVFYLLSELREVALKIQREKFRSLLAAGVMALAFSVMIAWMGRYRFFENPAFRQTIRCGSSGRLVCPSLDEDILGHRIGMLQAIRSLTLPGSRILGSDTSVRVVYNSLGWDSNDLAIRYYSLRPLAFTQKDGGALSYANHRELMTWWSQFCDLSMVKELRRKRIQFLDGLAAYSKKIRANFLVFPEKYDPQAYYPACLKNIYSNPHYSIYQVII